MSLTSGKSAALRAGRASSIYELTVRRRAARPAAHVRVREGRPTQAVRRRRDGVEGRSRGARVTVTVVLELASEGASAHPERRTRCQRGRTRGQKENKGYVGREGEKLALTVGDALAPRLTKCGGTDTTGRAGNGECTRTQRTHEQRCGWAGCCRRVSPSKTERRPNIENETEEQATSSSGPRSASRKIVRYWPGQDELRYLEEWPNPVAVGVRREAGLMERVATEIDMDDAWEYDCEEFSRL